MPNEQSTSDTRVPTLSNIPKSHRKDNTVEIRNYTDNFQKFYDAGAIDGICTEALQNMLDIWRELGLEDQRELRPTFRVSTAQQKVIIEDNGGGMPLEALKNSFTDFEKSYSKNHYEIDTGGFHGRGTAIYQDVAEIVFIETRYENPETGEIETTKALWKPEETAIQEDGEDLSDELERFGEDKLQTTGTRIELLGVDEKYLTGEDSISDREHVKEVIQKYWNDFISHPNVKILFDIDGEKFTIQPVKFSDRAIETEEVTEDFENDAGVDILDFKIYRFEDKRPEPFKDLVTINNHLYQTISHYAPQNIPESGKLMAVVKVSSEMQQFEKDSHRDYTTQHNEVVGDLRNFIKNQVKNYATEKFKGDEANITQTEKEAMDEGRASFNRLAGKVDSYNWIKRKKKKQKEQEEDEDPEHPFISTIGFVDAPKHKIFDYEQKANVSVEVTNPEDSEYDTAKSTVTAKILPPRGEGKTPIKVLDPVETSKMGKGEISVVNLSFDTPDDSHDKGRYRLKLKVETEKNGSGDFSKEGGWFRLNKKPEETEGGGTAKGFRDYTYADKEKMGDELARYDGDNVIIINTDHPEYRSEKQRTNDDEMDDFAFEVTVRKATQEEIENVTEETNDPKEIAKEINRVQKDAEKIRTLYHREDLEEIGA